jgi:hypothetical protein
VRSVGLRIIAAGAKSFIFEARVMGRPRRVTLGVWPDLTVVLACRRAFTIRTAIANGEDPQAAHLAEKREANLGELVGRYMSEYAMLHKEAALGRR